MIDLSTIPAERLEMLKTATLYHGWHRGAEGKHCARGLAYEAVTGEHADRNPPGATDMFGILPRMNDGPWRDDAHRTEFLRPYVVKFLALNPANDERRAYAVIDLVYRKILPDVCDALKLNKHGSTLRGLSPIVDRQSAVAALNTLEARAGRAVRASLALGAGRVSLAVRAALDALDGRAAVALGAGRAGRAAVAAVAALNTLDALGAVDARSEYWERGCRQVLDVICAIP